MCVSVGWGAMTLQTAGLQATGTAGNGHGSLGWNAALILPLILFKAASHVRSGLLLASNTPASINSYYTSSCATSKMQLVPPAWLQLLGQQDTQVAGQYLHIVCQVEPLELFDRRSGELRQPGAL